VDQVVERLTRRSNTTKKVKIKNNFFTRQGGGHL
jgi:hypothetical protein